jgi:hypothetical protein
MLTFIAIGCSQTSTGAGNTDSSSAVVVQDQTQKSSPLVKVGDLLSNPDSFQGQTVKLVGNVVDACAGNG